MSSTTSHTGLLRRMTYETSQLAAAPVAISAKSRADMDGADEISLFATPDERSPLALK